MITDNNAPSSETTGSILTRGDIAALLVAYYGAIKLDEIHADDLCSCGKRAREACRDNRYDHLRQIYVLLDTLPHISRDTLTDLTALAATHKPAVVREALIKLLAAGSSAHLVGERILSAPEFFNMLVKEVGGVRVQKAGGIAFNRMMRWLDPVDPLRTAQECGYKKKISPQGWT